MRIERTVVLEKHAYDRYCQRVGPISWRDLEQWIHKQLQHGLRGKDGYIQIGGVWWRGRVTRDIIHLYTCYGRTHIDIPEAIKWARLHKDRLVLSRYAD